MPELPDVTVYVEALESRVVGRCLEGIEVNNPFLLRTAEPPLTVCEKRRVLCIRRIGKRIVFGLEGDLWIVLHLMIAGRLHWYDDRYRGKTRSPLLRLHFENGLLTLTEAGTKRRASLHIVAGTAALKEFERGGLEVLATDAAEFCRRIRERNHTLKRALTDPTIMSGIGNAYSDEILHRARLSPLLQTKNLEDNDCKRLFDATKGILEEWTARLRSEARDKFPEGVTAFREGMATHGRYGKPCPVCGTAIQRIRYAENETNYCPRCQTSGKLLADRALSRLLKDDWPKTIEALENSNRRA
jgi:formamidopyrimidine-DNA glycosylase